MIKEHLKTRIKYQFFKENKVSDFSKLNLYYLNKIIFFVIKKELNYV